MSSSRKQTSRGSEANPLVCDLLAVIDRHAGPACQLDQTTSNANDQPEQAPQQVTHTSLQGNAHTSTADVLVGEQLETRPAGCADQQQAAATPLCQTVPLRAAHVAAVTSRQQPSSQHRKGAPRRRTEQTGRLPSPVSRVSALPPSKPIRCCNSHSMSGVALLCMQCSQHLYCCITLTFNAAVPKENRRVCSGRHYQYHALALPAVADNLQGR